MADPALIDPASGGLIGGGIMAAAAIAKLFDRIWPEKKNGNGQIKHCPVLPADKLDRMVDLLEKILDQLQDGTADHRVMLDRLDHLGKEK